jgi:hypothetical protein
VAAPEEGSGTRRDGGRGRSREVRRAQRWILASLVCLCPVPMTDFVLSAGFVPLGYVLFEALYWASAAPLLLYWIVVPYFVAFRFLSRWLAVRFDGATPEGTQATWWVVPASLVVMSLVPVYVPLSHGTESPVNVISLFHVDEGLAYLPRAPADWSKGWSKDDDAGRTLTVCTGPPVLPGRPDARIVVTRWDVQPWMFRQVQIHWGVEAPAEDRGRLDDAVTEEFRRVAPPVGGPAERLARLLRRIVDARSVAPRQYGRADVGGKAYSCVRVQHP